jgi:iron(III) transport system permease protein
MITVSAIIFLYPAKIPVSSVSIVNMDDAGDTASAAAMSTLIVLTSLFVRLIYEFTSRNVSKKSSVWINPLET